MELNCEQKLMRDTINKAKQERAKDLLSIYRLNCLILANSVGDSEADEYTFEKLKYIEFQILELLK